MNHHFGVSELSLLWLIPFLGILLSIAILPMVVPKLWHHHLGKVSLFWSISLIIPFMSEFGSSVALGEIMHTMLTEYFPFMILLFSLYTITGGIRFRGHFIGSPNLNVTILFIGTILASIIGTTGAAILLIRPIIEANHWRKNNVHVVVFFIFLVANIGGSLTPLGDPPLFLGFLQGVDFFWPVQNMILPMLLSCSILFGVFYILDCYFFSKEGGSPEHLKKIDPSAGGEQFQILGKNNIFLLLGVVFAVLMSGIWKSGVSIEILGTSLQFESILRDLLLLTFCFLSLKVSSEEIRKENQFTWFPIQEVSKLFFAIFITIIPVIAMLRNGSDGSLSFVTEIVNPEGNPNALMYFWVTGIISSFLDNAPTYLVFFNAASGDVEILTSSMNNILLAISCGAVFMGANTYIGNAPNFMVRSIAIERGIKMPSFFGYVVWSLIFLVPVYLIVGYIFFI